MHDLTLFIQHHGTLSVLFAVLLLLLLLIELLRLKNNAQHLTPLQAVHLINHQQALVVDLRPSDQFAQGHIIDALSVPLAEFKEKAKKIESMKTRPIILVCTKGLDSPPIAATLKKQGFHVHMLGHGIQAWTNANLPFVKE